MAAAAGQSPAAPPAPAPRVVTLGELVAVALAQHDDVSAARDEEARARLTVRLAASEFTPRVEGLANGAFGSGEAANQRVGLSASQRFAFGPELRFASTAGASQNQFGTFYTSSTALTLTQSIWGRARDSRAVALARSRADQAGRQLALVEQRVAVDVARLYYQLVASRQRLEVAQQGERQATLLVDQSKARLQVGRVSQLDVFRAEQLAAEARLQVLETSASIEDAKDDIRFLLRVGPSLDVEPEPGLQFAYGRMSADEAVAQALRTRPEVAAAEAEVRHAEVREAMARSALRPTLDVGVAFTRFRAAADVGDTLGVDGFRPGAFVNLLAPIGRTEGGVALANAGIDLSGRRRALETTRLAIANEARRGTRRVDQLLASLTLAEAHVGLAEQERELARVRYQRGISNNLDVVNAETSVMRAKGRRSELLGQLAVAHLELRLALGTLDPRRDVH
jgi:outer membrane protein